jgi:copper homeostasis protein
MELEACIETIEEAKAASLAKFNRVELCSALDLGGLTPSSGLIQECAQHIETHVMIRPRAGDFVYSDEELTIMMQDICQAKHNGAAGVVFGCLDHTNSIDAAACKALVNIANEISLDCTFHRAIDFVSEPLSTLAQLIELGFNRVLTYGGKATAPEGMGEIKKFVEIAQSNIEIMAGSGINASNIKLIESLGVHASHFSIHQKKDESHSYGMGRRPLVDNDKIRSIQSALKN